MKLISKYKALFWLFFCIYLMMQPCVGTAETDMVADNTFCNDEGDRESFAWTDEYLFITHGYLNWPEEQFCWIAPRFSLTRVDIEKGVMETLYESINACMPNLLIDEEAQRLYIVWQMKDGYYYYDEDGKSHTFRDEIQVCTLIAMDYDGTILETDKFYINDYVDDYYLYQKRLYLITNADVFVWDIEKKELHNIYEAQENLYNDMGEAHCLVIGGKMYIQDGASLLNIDLSTYETATLCGIQKPSDEYWSNENLLSMDRRYRYIALDGSIYFVNKDAFFGEGFQIVKTEIEGKKRTQRPIEDNYVFKQVNEDGVLAYSVKDGKYRLWFYPFASNGTEKIEMENTAILIGNGKYIVVDDCVFYETYIPNLYPPQPSTLCVPIYDLKK